MSLASRAGAETTTLAVGNLPSHTHTLSAVQAKATTQAPATGSQLARATDSSATGSLPQIYAPAGTQFTLGGVGATGSNTPIANLSPYLAINYCIATSGIYPSRN